MKKFLIWLGKVALMIGLLAAAAFAWFCILLEQYGLGWGPGGGPSELESMLDTVLIPATFALYIFICVKISRLGTEKPDNSAGFWEKAKQPLITIIPALALAACILAIAPIIEDAIWDKRYEEREIARQEAYERNTIIARETVQNADEIVVYGSGREIFIEENGEEIPYSPFGSGVYQPSAAINYADKTVSLIFHSTDYYNGDIGDKLDIFVLESGENIDKQDLVFMAELSSPGKSFSVYHLHVGEYGNHTGIRLEMEDGSVYSKDVSLNPPSSYKFDSLYSDFMKASETADEIIPYGENVMPKNIFGIETNTMYIDYDKNTLYIFYQYGNCIECYDVILEKAEKVMYENWLDDFYLQAKIDLKSGGTMYTFTHTEYVEYAKDITDGLALFTKDGELYYHFRLMGYKLDFYHSKYRADKSEHVRITSDGIEKIEEE